MNTRICLLTDAECVRGCGMICLREAPSGHDLRAHLRAYGRTAEFETCNSCEMRSACRSVRHCAGVAQPLTPVLRAAWAAEFEALAWYLDARDNGGDVDSRRAVLLALIEKAPGL